MKAKVSAQEIALGLQAVSSSLGTGKPTKIGDFLVQAGVIKQKDIEKALGIQQAKGGRLGSILVDLKICTEETIRKALREQFDMEVVDLDLVKPDPALLDLLSIDLIRKYEVIPLKQEDGKLWIAMMDPYNLVAIDDIRFKTGISKLVVTTCTEGDFKRFTNRNLVTEGVIEEILQERDFYNRAIKSLSFDENYKKLVEEQATPLTAHRLKLASSESPIITLCNFLLLEAIRWTASDIHIEPYENALRIRIRIDGHLQTLINPPKKLAAAIVARIKVMAEMDITKRRIPQDGHLSVSYESEAYHFRVSTIPTIYGEKCVIRLLKRDSHLSSLDQLNLSPEEMAVLKKKLKAPQGLILLTGPTGSGKTTTVHAGLNYISHPSINIVTLEDPVEVSFYGINHVPVNRQGGMTFASGLRSILRQDPEVIFVGEMRDSEVATIAMQAAQTGHLVLSTLHTNSSMETIERLTDMGVPPYILASSLLLVIAQRLVRRVCELCAEPYALSREEIAMLGIDAARLASATPRIGHGCKGCMGTGYRGRMAVFEMLQVTREIKELIRKQAGPEALMASAKASGTRFILETGVEKVLRGETTPAEVSRVLQLDT